MATLEINDERRSRQQDPNYTEPDPAVDKVRIRTESQASNKRDKFSLATRVNDVRNAQGARDDTDEKSGHENGLL